MHNPEINFQGVLSALTCLSCITIGMFIQKKVRVSLPMSMAIQYLSGLVIIGALAPYFGELSVNWSSLFIVCLFWMVCIISVGSSLLLYMMIRRGNLMNVTSLLYAVPPITSILDYIVFNNKLSSISYLGMLLVILGLSLVNRKGSLV